MRTSRSTRWHHRLLACVCVLAVPAAAEEAASRPAEAGKELPVAPQCGQYAIQHCCQLLGVPIEMSALMDDMPPRDKGHSMMELIQALQRIGLRAEGRAGSLDSLCQGSFPVIAHTSQNHYVAIEKLTENAVILLDGFGRRKVWSVGRFEREWDGKIIRVSRPQPDRALPDCGAQTGPAPRLQFDALFKDHGMIPAGQNRVEFVFEFRNLGSADLTIEKIRTSCRCLESTKPDQPIPPGQSGQISLTYAVSEPGPFFQTAYVHSNDSCQPIIHLGVAGNTDRRIFPDPQMIELGRIAFGQTRTVRCTIIGVSDLPVELLDVTCDLPGARVEHLELSPKRLQNLQVSGARVLGNVSNAHLVCLTIEAEGATPGPLKGQINITTNTKGFEHIVVPIRGEIVEPLYLAPGVLYLGEVGDHESIEKRITLVSRVEAPFQVHAVGSPESGIQCTFPRESQRGRCELNISAVGAEAAKVSGKTIAVRVESASVPGVFVLPLKVYARLKTGP